MIADRVKQYRETRNLSQTELAKLIGVSQTMVCQIERGYLPSGRTRRKIEKFLEAKNGKEGNSKKAKAGTAANRTR